jgi:hypothetical protein
MWMRGIVSLFFALACTASVQAGEEPVLRQGADGQYHYHDAEWAGAWIPTRCCGKGDCHQANQGDGFAVRRLEDGSGYLVTIPQATGERITYQVPYNDPNVGPAEDGEYWVCTRNDSGISKLVPRCVFTPPLGM